VIYMERIDKVLANSGYGTRTEIKKLIKTKVVQVDGLLVKDPGMRVDPNTQDILIHGKQIQYRKFIYLMMNKPQGVISATEDNLHETVIDLLEPEHKVFEPFPVGRLDIDTTGLLLITNDGEFAHRLLAPKKHVAKRYRATLSAPVGEKEIEIFKNGVILDYEYKCLPAELILNKKSPDSIESDDVDVIIYEGKHHQVKKMFLSVGCEVQTLERLEMGPYKLDLELEPGEYQEFEPLPEHLSD